MLLRRCAQVRNRNPGCGKLHRMADKPFFELPRIVSSIVPQPIP
jgi:hypothetical protein